MNRRDFCVLAATGLGMNAINGVLPTVSGSRKDAASQIIAVVHDERFGDAREFADHLRKNGAIEFSIGNCSAAIWYGRLGTLLRRRRGMVAGMSTYADLLIAKDCGREMGFQLVFEGVHDARGSDHVAHFYRTRALHLTHQFAGYSALMPSDLAECLIHIGTQGWQGWIGFEAIGPRRTDHPGYLTSWLLAPPRPPNLQ
jgi:hypothetical protein